MPDSTVVATIYLTASSPEALLAAIAAFESDHGERVCWLEVPQEAEHEDYWLARGIVLAEKPGKPQTNDDRLNLLLIGVIGVLCAINLILLKLTFNVSPVDGLNLGIVGLVALGLAWRCVRRASKLD